MARPFTTQRQKGPRGYIVFSSGRAVAVTGLAKEASAIVKRIKARHCDAVHVRYPSQSAAEERAAWHNYERDMEEAAEAASRDARIAARRASTSGRAT